MDTSMRDLRVQAQELARGRDARTVRYPAAFRDAAVMLARKQIREGESVERIAAELGVSSPTLAHWLRPTPPSVVRPVAVMAEPPREPASPVVLVTPQGLRIEGLDPDGLIVILRALL